MQILRKNLTIVILTGRVHMSMAPYHKNIRKGRQAEYENLHDVPIGAVSKEGADLGAAEAEHEEERREDVDPEVDHNHLRNKDLMNMKLVTTMNMKLMRTKTMENTWIVLSHISGSGSTPINQTVPVTNQAISKMM